MPSANEQYDLVFSLGQACPCSMTLRMAGLQFASFPLDWVTGGTMVQRVKLVASHFADWFEMEDFEYHGRNPKNGLGVFTNRRTGFRHPHDFPDAPVETEFDKVRAKYLRRETRLYERIAASSRVLAVYITRPDETPADIQILESARRILSGAFPNATFDLLHFVHREGVSFANRNVLHPTEHVTQIIFDYRDPERDVRMEDTAEAIKSLGLAAKDWRTDEEKKAFTRRKEQEAQRRKSDFKLKQKMEKYGATTRLGLLWARLKRHLGLGRTK